MKLTSMLPPNRHYWRFLSVVIAMIIATAGGASLAQTPSAEVALPEGPIGEQIGWVIDAANGEVSIPNPLTVISHFSPEYIETEGLDALIDLAYGLVRMWAPVTLESVEVSDDGASGVALLSARDGTLLELIVDIDTESGLITDVLVEPVDIGTPEASPVVSPAAVAPAPSFADIEADYTATIDLLTKTGQESVALFLTGDYQAIVDKFAPHLVGDISSDALAAGHELLTTNRVHFELADVGAVFDGYVSGDTIEGFFSQGSAFNFTLTAEIPQTGSIPTGTWSGTINEIGLDVSVTFTGDADTLNATLSIPSQNLFDQPLANVTFEPVRPIGNLLNERSLALSKENSGYRASYEWGSGYLVFIVFQSEDGTLTAFAPVPQWPLPVDPTAAVLPIEALWKVPGW